MQEMKAMGNEGAEGRRESETTTGMRAPFTSGLPPLSPPPLVQSAVTMSTSGKRKQWAGLLDFTKCTTPLTSPVRSWQRAVILPVSSSSSPLAPLLHQAPIIIWSLFQLKCHIESPRLRPPAHCLLGTAAHQISAWGSCAGLSPFEVHYAPKDPEPPRQRPGIADRGENVTRVVVAKHLSSVCAQDSQRRRQKGAEHRLA